MNGNIPVTKEHAQLRALAEKVLKLSAADPQIIWLAGALAEIGRGRDANITLGIAGGKGKDRRGQQAHYRTQQAIRWIAGRLNPLDENEETPTKTKAVEEAAAEFNLDNDKLYRACPSIPNLKKLVEFDWDSQRPILNKPRIEKDTFRS